MTKDVSETILKYTIIGLKNVQKLSAAVDKLSIAQDKLGKSTKVSSKLKTLDNSVNRLTKSVTKGKKAVVLFGITWKSIGRIILASAIAQSYYKSRYMLYNSKQIAYSFR